MPLLLVAAWAEPASAHVERFAVLIGNDIGTPEETPLRYATADALRMQTVLRELGGFEPFNMVLLRNEDAATARSTLLSMNERIREAVARPDTDVLFLVYYSGHADARQLHLGDSELPVRELAQIVRGSAATFRLVVLDACRSGTLTRVKGGRVVDPFALPDDRLPGDGLAYLTSASASEDAQESDRLQGSFFTHSLISGLMGAADRDGNGSVVLEEAYRYAYDATRRATSRTRAGTQHPTFRYDFRGSGQLVLTRPGAQPHTRGRLLLPSGMSFMLMREDEDGAVVAELSSRAPRRELSVRPGRYFVRARGTDVLFEGEVRVGAGASRQVDPAEMRRIEYAQLVRKGEGRARLAQGPEAGMRVRSPLPNEAQECIGAFGDYAVDFASV
ncbi:MAG: caspase family protein, partial [Myxococcales bacterium]|nr:caspase family protein [Myxococcales bacterium]